MRNMRMLMLGLVGMTSIIAACGTEALGPNPFLTLTETLGVSTDGNDNTGGGGGGQDAVTQFRRGMTVTLRNNSEQADLNVSLLAWVTPSSIRSAEQQDALLANGYVQLNREVRLGTVFTLVPGTFVLNGTGFAEAIPVTLDPAENAVPTERVFSMITPDVVLLYSQPPVSCDTVAFTFTVDGVVLTDQVVGGGLGTFEGSTGAGGYKTLAQVDAYQCEPLRPGFFLKVGGGARQDNEFFEGQSISVDFFQQARPNDGIAAVATIQ